MTEFSASRNQLFAMFVNYRSECDQWSDGYDRTFCTLTAIVQIHFLMWKESRRE